MKNVLTIFCLLSCLAGYSQNNDPLVKFVNPKTLSAPKGYSHVAIINLGTCRMVILSGQVPLDSQGNLVGKGDLAKQTDQVFTNIKNTIAEVGGSMEHIVKFGYFVVDGNDIQPIRNVRDKYINTQNPPASTLVKVSHLYRDDILLEIEATFIIPNQ